MRLQDRNSSFEYLRLDRVSVVFCPRTQNELHALNNCSFSAGEGELTFILGSNGSGKTTLLKAITSACEYTGTITLDGMRLGGAPQHELSKQISRVTQDLAMALVQDMTVEENFILAGLRTSGSRLRLARSSMRKRNARESLATLGLGFEDRMGHLAGDLSGGQRQALALAMALFNNPPKLLLLDEPTASTDPRMTKVVERLVLSKRGPERITTLWVTHDPNQALRHADRLIILRAGHVSHSVVGDAIKDLDENKILTLVSN